jgi:hypothetical protein
MVYAYCRCGSKTLFQTERFDECSTCGYSCYYRDAYAEIEISERLEKFDDSKNNID